MAVERIVTKDRKNGKLVAKYRVKFRDPMRDEFGIKRKGKYHNRTETYATKAEAEARDAELKAAKHTTGTAGLAEQRKAGELPVGYYARRWLDTLTARVASGKLKQATVDEYARLLHCYVLPVIGSAAVASVTPARCEQFLAALVRRQSTQGNAEPLSPGTVKHAYDMLRRVLKYAHRHGAISSNPTAAIEFTTGGGIGDHERFEYHPLTLAQLGAFCDAVAGHAPADYIGPRLPAYLVYALMVEFMAKTGLRAAEVSGLEVGDVKFAPSADPNALNAVVQVRRAKHRKKVKGREKPEWVTGTLKTKNSRRTVPLEAGLAAKVADYLVSGHERANVPTAPLWPS
jgi:integrase